MESFTLEVLCKTSRIAIILMILLLVSPRTACARLGETAQGCVDRYGQPIAVNRANPAGPYMDFRFNGLIIRCFYVTSEPDSVCEQILYRTDIAAGAVTWDVFQRVLELNSQGSTWGEPTSRESSLGTVTEWQRQDGADADYVRGSGLKIRSRELNERLRREQKNEVNARTNGL